MRKKIKNKKQFTLIELIIVIVVIGILAAMAMPKFIGVQRNAHVAAMEQDLDVIEKAVMQYVMATDDGSYPFVDVNSDTKINEEDLYFKTNPIPQTLTDTLLKANDDGSKIYKLDMDKLKPYIDKLKYPDTEYVYSPNSDTAIDPIGKPDGDNFIHHIIGGGITDENNNQILSEYRREYVATSGMSHYFIDSSNNLYSWGVNGSGELGIENLGQTQTQEPGLVKLSENVKPINIVVSQQYKPQVFSIGDDGNLYAWGSNSKGELGLGNKINQFTPKKVDIPTKVKMVSTNLDSNNNSQTFVLCEDGSVYAFGYNTSGQLCTGDTEDKITPTQILVNENIKFKYISASMSGCFLIDENDNLYALGLNVQGELGTGVIGLNQLTKIELPEGIKIKKIKSKSFNSIILTENGDVYSVGDNYLETNTTGKFQKIEQLKNIKDIDKSRVNCFIVLTNDKEIFVWGKNSNNELGVGKAEDTLYPTPTLTPMTTLTKVNLPNSVKANSVYLEEYNSLISCDDGKLYASGENGYYLIDKTFYRHNSFTPLAINDTFKIKQDEKINNVAKKLNIKKIVAGQQNSLFLNDDGSVYSLGQNQYGILGLSTQTHAFVLTRIDAFNKEKIIDISCASNSALALSSEGTLYSWGYNLHGELGLGDTKFRGTPTKVNLPNNITTKKISIGFDNSLIIGSDGELYSCGFNRHGTLGDGTTIDSAIFKKIELAPNVKPIEISTNGETSLAIGNDGNLYSWGNNEYGQLGLGNTEDQTTPQLVTLPNGVKPVQIKQGFYHVLMIGDDNNLYGWGNNSAYQLGIDGTDEEDILELLVPTKITLKDGVSPVSIFTNNISSYAIGDDGNAYSWGSNQKGQSGRANGETNRVPTKIDFGSNIKISHIGIGLDHMSAVASNGEIYVCGFNYLGLLGLRDNTNRYTPTKLNLN